MVTRKRTEFDGYIGVRPYESKAQPSYCIEIFRKSFFP